MIIVPTSLTASAASIVTILTGDDKNLSAKYPDLNKQELALVKNFTVRFPGSRKKILKRIKQLHKQLEHTSGNKQQKLMILAKLLNFNQFLRESLMPPKFFAEHAYSENYVDLRQCGEEKLALDIPEDVKLALDVGGEKHSYPDYVERNVRRAYFVKQLGEHIKILKEDKWDGTSEESSRSVIIDTYNEKGKRLSEAWEMAAVLVHEAAHIEYFYSNMDKVEKEELLIAERYAYIKEIGYLYRLWRKTGEDKNIPKTTKEKIGATLQRIVDQVNDLNKSLKLAPYNFRTEK